MENQQFYSIDRLLDFGIGMAMAQQTVQVMNNMMHQMQVPGSPSTIPASRAEQIYVGIGGKPVGPLTSAEFKQLVANGQITKTTLSWQPGDAQWQPVESVPALLALIALTPPPLPNV